MQPRHPLGRCAALLRSMPGGMEGARRLVTDVEAEAPPFPTRRAPDRGGRDLGGGGGFDGPLRRAAQPGGALRCRVAHCDAAAAREAGSRHRHRRHQRADAEALPLSFAGRPRVPEQPPAGDRRARAARDRARRAVRSGDGTRQGRGAQGDDRHAQGAARGELHQRPRARRPAPAYLSQRFPAARAPRRRRDRPRHVRDRATGSCLPSRSATARC